MTNTINDTIAAISTPSGEGGIGIVRLSGKDSFDIADRMFFPPGDKKTKLSSCDSHTVHYGYIKKPDNGEVLDEVLLTVMRAPKTYTAEDIVEIGCHGGNIPLKKVLELCLGQGAKVAEPGEFTKRAFLNGRLDLSQAEAVLDIIKAETDVSCKIAVEQLRGTVSEEIRNLRSSIIDIVSSVELTIDFTEEDVDFPVVEAIVRRLNDSCRKINNILKTSDRGIIIREGASVVICGRPNVGKSSLMNALLRHDRVIVTPIAGTTRDVIEEAINIAGVKVRVSDTAGIIDTRDRVEMEGIKRSREKLKNADIVIFVVDYNRSLSSRDEEIYKTIKDNKTVIIANKTDLPGEFDINEASKRFDGEKILKVSALKKKGLEAIEDAIAGKLFGGVIKIPEGVIVTNVRHKKLLEDAVCSIERAVTLITDKGYNGELLASDLNETVHRLGLIIGESIGDDILDRIFSRFCIGK